MEQNVTESSDITAGGSSSMAYIVDGIMLLISVFGIAGNSMSMFILTSSVKIRKSRSYVLLMNQCLLDFATTILMIPTLLFKYFGHWSSMSGSWDLIICHVMYSQLYATIPIFSSTYNLVAMSVERMTSVVWPVFHKVRCTRRMTLVVAVTTWVLGFCINTALSLPVNGINMENRKCYYWNNLSSPLNSQIYSVLYNILFILFPLLVMLTSYTVMYVSILSGRMRLGVKLNVARMLATCVLLFLFCHILKVTLVMISKFTSNNLFGSTIFVVGVIMMQSNSIVNPFIYSIQYMDYKTELKRQISRITGRMSSTVNTTDSEESTTSSSIKLTN